MKGSCLASGWRTPTCVTTQAEPHYARLIGPASSDSKRSSLFFLWRIIFNVIIVAKLCFMATKSNREHLTAPPFMRRCIQGLPKCFRTWIFSKVVTCAKFLEDTRTAGDGWFSEIVESYPQLSIHYSRCHLWTSSVEYKNEEEKKKQHSWLTRGLWPAVYRTQPNQITTWKSLDKHLIVCAHGFLYLFIIIFFFLLF